MERTLSDSGDTQHLVAQAAGGDEQALTELMERYRARLERMVALRMDRQLQGRVDASDIVQDALIEASRRLDEYAADPPMGFYIWLRWLTGERLLNTHRHQTLNRQQAVYQRPQAAQAGAQRNTRIQSTRELMPHHSSIARWGATGSASAKQERRQLAKHWQSQWHPAFQI